MTDVSSIEIRLNYTLNGIMSQNMFVSILKGQGFDRRRKEKPQESRKRT